DAPSTARETVSIAGEAPESLEDGCSAVLLFIPVWFGMLSGDTVAWCVSVWQVQVHCRPLKVFTGHDL
ncbi:hypothetical protein, partial [Streptomyces sp. WAC02707]|uniref:hypothetical protein n=1 Tax=Streptomyces sp. WAC02707 TaxID=2487417 RepID=UPI001C8D167F